MCRFGSPVSPPPERCGTRRRHQPVLRFHRGGAMLHGRRRHARVAVRRSASAAANVLLSPTLVAMARLIPGVVCFDGPSPTHFVSRFCAPTPSEPRRCETLRLERGDLLLSIIMSINADRTDWTKTNSADQAPSESLLSGSCRTEWTACGRLAVSPIRPPSHLSSGSFARGPTGIGHSSPRRFSG